jgi:hypothetical protein
VAVFVVGALTITLTAVARVLFSSLVNTTCWFVACSVKWNLPLLPWASLRMGFPW